MGHLHFLQDCPARLPGQDQPPTLPFFSLLLKVCVLTLEELADICVGPWWFILLLNYGILEQEHGSMWIPADLKAASILLYFIRLWSGYRDLDEKMGDNSMISLFGKKWVQGLDQ